MSELARKLIAENKRTKDPFLDLGNCGLTEVPAEVGELVWLEGVSLASEWWEFGEADAPQENSRNQGDKNARLTDIGPLARLAALKSLTISNTQVSNLMPLAALSSLARLDVSYTQVSDLKPLASLLSLQELRLNDTQVSDLTPLAGLSSLTHIWAYDTGISDLEPLARLSSLMYLSVIRTQVSNLTPLAGLSSLEHLYLSQTQVVDLTPLADLLPLVRLAVHSTPVSDLMPLSGLSELRFLDVSGTLVTDLTPISPSIRRGAPVLWSFGTGGTLGICVKDCPLTNPPPEIAKQGSEAILNYFREREADEIDHLYEAKMLILGEGGAGKTSLLRRLYEPEKPLPGEDETTKGISIYRHEFDLQNGRRFRLNVWDFGGQEIYHATHQFFLTHRSLYLLVDDTRKDHKSVSDEGFKYWLELIDVFGGHSPVLIFQNEKGGRTKAIDFAGIKGRFDNVKERYGGNLDQLDAADAVRGAIEFFANNLSHIGEELPARWIKVRSEIEARADETPYIPQQEYFDIYGRHMEFDRTKALHLSRYLHDLGVFLHFQDDPLLRRTVILQNQWATEAVFRILDDETVKARLGRFDNTDCERLWRDSVYAEMHPELLALMQRFELCYELKDSTRPTWLAPQLLPPAKPTELADSARPADLVLRYRYDFLPKGTISRLTVRQHRFVHNPQKAWVTGVLFERDSTSVLVQVLAKGSEIELRARGPERKELLSVIAEDLDALNESFQGLRDKVDKRIPCNCRACQADAIPEFFSHKDLLRRKEHRRLKVECPRSYQDADVLELLDGIRVELPTWAKEAPRSTVSEPIRIFLASSSELREDRDAFDLYFRRQNDRLRKEGLYLEIIRWEYFLDAMSETRLQDEYNKRIRECDVFVCLFRTKTGKFTEEEFDVAHQQFLKTRRPRIFTFFESANVKVSELREEDINSLFAFKKRLKDLGHFYTEYKNLEDLKLQFRDQLDLLFG